MKTLRNDMSGPLVPDNDIEAVPPGGTFEVSDERAEELLTDPELMVSEATSSIARLNKGELIALAQERGIETDGLTKAELIDAIENPPETTSETEPAA